MLEEVAGLFSLKQLYLMAMKLLGAVVDLFMLLVMVFY